MDGPLLLPQINTGLQIDQPLPAVEYLQQYAGGAQSSSAAANSNNSADCGAPSVPQGQEDEILKRYEALQRVRKAAEQAAEIAKRDAEDLARLQAEADRLQPIPTTEVKEVYVSWPPESKTVPADYNVAAANAPVLKARAERILELGDYWAKQQGREMYPEDEKVRAAARQAGTFPELARQLKQRLESDE